MLLSDICEIIMGQSPSSDSYNVKGQGFEIFRLCISGGTPSHSAG